MALRRGPGRSTRPLAQVSETPWQLEEGAETVKSNPPAREREVRVEQKRQAFSLRLLDEMKAELQKWADKRGRPVSEEIELRLQNSLRDSEELGSLETQVVFRVVALAIHAEELIRGTPWHRWHESARELSLDAIEQRLGHSSRWWPMPEDLADDAEAFLSANTPPGTDVSVTFARIIRAGMQTIRENPNAGWAEDHKEPENKLMAAGQEEAPEKAWKSIDFRRFRQNS